LGRKRKRMIWGIILGIFIIGGILAAPTAWWWWKVRSADNYDEMLQELYSHTVDEVAVDTVYQWLNTAHNLYILDSREREEYEVSHLPEAIWVGYKDFSMERCTQIPKHAKIVIYCSVGYRSEKIGNQLQKAGYEDVHNLYGGVFEWVNKSYPVVNEKEIETKDVHAFSPSWGKWLKKGNKIYQK